MILTCIKISKKNVLVSTKKKLLEFPMCHTFDFTVCFLVHSTELVLV